MRLLVSWLRDFVDVKAPAAEIGERLGLRGFELAGIEPLGEDDAVLDFEVTANRPDCLSVIGLAREVAALYDLPLMNPPKPVPAAQRSTGLSGVEESRSAQDDSASHSVASSEIRVSVDDPDLCPRYAVAVAEVQVGPSPEWMAARLRAAGLRPISSIVDITNYVLIELGHPTHAFDFDKLAGPELRIRRATPGEHLVTLDDVDRALEPEMLVIADRDRAQAVAGVMGGAKAEVSPATRRAAFESAYFKPASIRRTSKRLGLKSEASSRFERGADINAPLIALHRIAALLDAIGAGRFLSPIIDIYPAARSAGRLHMRRDRLARLLGASVPDPEVERILQHLGLGVALVADGWDVSVPTFRVDLLREVDLIEEVGRHYGLEKLPATFPVVTAPAAPPDPRIPRDRVVRRVMAAAGLSEAVTFGFIEAKTADAFLEPDGQRPIPIANPLSAKFDTLRPTLVPGLVDAVAHNRRHGRDQVALFEIGARFSAAGETRAAAIAWTGPATAIHWSGTPRLVDFFDVKGIVEQLGQALGVTMRFEPSREVFLVPEQTAAVIAADGRVLGVIGQLLPSLADARGLPRQDAVFVAELNLDVAWEARGNESDATRTLPRYPWVVRDLSLVVSNGLPAEIIRGTIQSAGRTTPAPLLAVIFFDRYQGTGIPDGSVSLSVRMTFQAPDKTLTDAEVQASVEAILAALASAHQAIQR